MQKSAPGPQQSLDKYLTHPLDADQRNLSTGYQSMRIVCKLPVNKRMKEAMGRVDAPKYEGVTTYSGVRPVRERKRYENERHGDHQYR